MARPERHQAAGQTWPGDSCEPPSPGEPGRPAGGAKSLCGNALQKPIGGGGAPPRDGGAAVGRCEDPGFDRRAPGHRGSGRRGRARAKRQLGGCGRGPTGWPRGRPEHRGRQRSEGVTPRHAARRRLRKMLFRRRNDPRLSDPPPSGCPETAGRSDPGFESRARSREAHSVPRFGTHARRAQSPHLLHPPSLHSRSGVSLSPARCLVIVKRSQRC